MYPHTFCIIVKIINISITSTSCNYICMEIEKEKITKKKKKFIQWIIGFTNMVVPEEYGEGASINIFCDRSLWPSDVLLRNDFLKHKKKHIFTRGKFLNFLTDWLTFNVLTVIKFFLSSGKEHPKSIILYPLPLNYVYVSII